MESEEFVKYIEGWVPVGKCPKKVAEDALAEYCPVATRRELEVALDGVTDEVVAYCLFKRMQMPFASAAEMLGWLLAKFEQEAMNAQSEAA